MNTLAGIWSLVFVQMECVDGWSVWVVFVFVSSLVTLLFDMDLDVDVELALASLA